MFLQAVPGANPAQVVAGSCQVHVRPRLGVLMDLHGFIVQFEGFIVCFAPGGPHYS